MNRRDGTFEESGLLSGVALNDDGQEQGGMGVAIADLDEDGHPDIVKTNFSDDVPNVYRNRGDGTFEDRVFQSGLGGYMQYVGWGVHLIDVDHDGRREILMVNGHVYPDAAQLPGLGYRQPRLLYWNVGGGRFKDISGESGPGIREALVVARIGGRRPRQRRGARGRGQQHRMRGPACSRTSGRARTGCSCGAVGTRANKDAIGARARSSSAIAGSRARCRAARASCRKMTRGCTSGSGPIPLTRASRSSGRRARWSGFRAVRRIESSW